jgi:hypothetical protein
MSILVHSISIGSRKIPSQQRAPARDSILGVSYLLIREVLEDALRNASIFNCGGDAVASDDVSTKI